MEAQINQQQLKDLIKSALIEVLQERRDLLYEAVEEAIEDIALARAIQEGENAELVERDEVFKLFEDRA
jgi:DNA polymerase III alpha subunit